MYHKTRRQAVMRERVEVSLCVCVERGELQRRERFKHVNITLPCITKRVVKQSCERELKCLSLCVCVERGELQRRERFKHVNITLLCVTNTRRQVVTCN